MPARLGRQAGNDGNQIGHQIADRDDRTSVRIQHECEASFYVNFTLRIVNLNTLIRDTLGQANHTVIDLFDNPGLI